MPCLQVGVKCSEICACWRVGRFIMVDVGFHLLSQPPSLLSSLPLPPSPLLSYCTAPTIGMPVFTSFRDGYTLLG